MSQQTFTAEELELTATHYAKGADRDWWPECPEVFRDEWARTTAMLTYAATLVRRLESIAQWAETTEPQTFQDHGLSWLEADQAAKREVRALLTPPEAQ